MGQLAGAGQVACDALQAHVSKLYIIATSYRKNIMKKQYGVEVKDQREKVRPVPMDLSGKEGRRVVMSAAKRVMATHADVIKALAKR